MYEMISSMINNIFFIIFPIILYQLFAPAGRRDLFSSHQTILTVLFSVSVFLCVQFPYHFLMDDYIFDLRQVPMIVGALYGGPVVSAVLFVVFAFARSLIGGDGMYVAIMNQLLISAIVPMLRPAYQRMNRLAKVGFVFLISIAAILLSMVTGFILFNHLVGDFVGVWLVLMLNQGALISLTVLLIEHVQRQEYMLTSLMKHEKLETVSHFAASVSHELRNPIQSIKGFVQLMKTQEYEKEKQQEFFNTILEEINAAEQLIEDYLVFAKPTYGQVEEVSVKSEVEQLLKIMGPYAAGHKVEIELLDFEDQVKILVDRQKLQQALINIIRNGIDAMPRGGTFYIRQKVVGSKVHIELTDEGVGMTREQVQRLGEPYFSTKTKGTGLGMMVTYSIIRQMNGEISVRSERGKGTTFIVRFPFTQKV